MVGKVFIVHNIYMYHHENVILLPCSCTLFQFVYHDCEKKVHLYKLTWMIMLIVN